MVIGFTNAGSIIIATSQIPKIFGLNIKADEFEHSYEFWWATAQSIPSTHLIILAMGGGSKKRPNLIEVSRDKDGTMRDAKLHGLRTSEMVAVYRFDGDLYFANAGYLESKLLNNIADKPRLKVLILDMQSVDRIDSTGAKILEKLADDFKSAGIEFYIARLKYRVYEALRRCGLVDHIGEERFFRERKHAIRHAKALFGDAIDVGPLERYMPVVKSATPLVDPV